MFAGRFRPHDCMGGRCQTPVFACEAPTNSRRRHFTCGRLWLSHRPRSSAFITLRGGAPPERSSERTSPACGWRCAGAEVAQCGRELGWFWVLPSQTLSTDPRAGIVPRHHLSDAVVQKAVKAAAREAKIHKPVSVHTLRHSFATVQSFSGRLGVARLTLRRRVRQPVRAVNFKDRPWI
jgi:integrase